MPKKQAWSHFQAYGFRYMASGSRYALSTTYCRYQYTQHTENAMNMVQTGRMDGGLVTRLSTGDELWISNLFTTPHRKSKKGGGCNQPLISVTACKENNLGGGRGGERPLTTFGENWQGASLKQVNKKAMESRIHQSWRTIIMPWSQWTHTVGVLLFQPLNYYKLLFCLLQRSRWI